MVGWLLNLWRARRRALDLKILWPSCKELSSDLDEARAVFAVHAYIDAAWSSLGEDEVFRIVSRLQ